MSEFGATTKKVRQAWQYANGPCACCLGGYCMENGIEFDNWLSGEIAAAKAEAWDEGYRMGVSDARTADDVQVDVGLGPGLYAQPSRVNPYRADKITH